MADALIEDASPKQVFMALNCIASKCLSYMKGIGRQAVNQFDAFL